MALGGWLGVHCMQGGMQVVRWLWDAGGGSLSKPGSQKVLCHLHTTAQTTCMPRASLDPPLPERLSNPKRATDHLRARACAASFRSAATCRTMVMQVAAHLANSCITRAGMHCSFPRRCACCQPYTVTRGTTATPTQWKAHRQAVATTRRLATNQIYLMAWGASCRWLFA